MRIIYFKKDEKHVLGRAGENGATRITVDVAAWAAEYPSGVGALVFRRPDGSTYPLTATLDGGSLCAVLTSVDTAVSGACRVEAQWLDGDVIVKSCAYEGVVAASLGEAGNAPSATPNWVDTMTALGVTVGADAAQVAADKEIVAADKAAANGSADDAQAARVAAENSAASAAQTAARIVTNEAERASAETSRNTAEGLRLSAETARQEAEALRVEAEAVRMGFKPMGAYNPANENKYGEWYTHEGGSYGYIYPTPSTGVPVTDASHWQQIAEKGDQGIQGVQGIQGEIGPQGIQGPKGDTGDPTSSTASDIPTSTAGVSVQKALDAVEAWAQNIFTYKGVDLSTVFASAAEFIAVVRAGNFSKIRIGDYWPIRLTGTYRDVGSYTCPAGTTLYSDTALTTEAGTAASILEAQWIDATYCNVSSGGDKYCATSDCLAYFERTLSNALLKLEVAAINPYWRYGDSGELTGDKNHVLFISRDCLPHYLRFRKANTAWHIAPDPTGGIGVWQGSALYTTLNDADNGVLPLLAATDIGAYIYGGASGGGMRYYGETRATEATTSSSGAWLNRGKLFLPTEDEVWGREIFTIRSYQGHLHLPLFNGSRRHISKGIGAGGSRTNWWEMSAYAGNATFICNVNYSGYPNNYSAIYGIGAPVCFLAI
ncbi:MAG TPA: hypothetical protein PKL77_09555 [Candidatus Omnitrophota bacterium]|nr:hypothetical protein [Candidatus Omnitrophota bacterium]